MKRLLSILAAIVLVAQGVQAAPIRYALDAEASQVRFTVGFGPDRITGTLPVRSSDVALDFENPPNSRVSVTLDTDHAVASFPFATQALRGPKVLDTRSYPTMVFSTTDLRADGQRAKVRGDLTIRGTTRPVILDAQVFRQQGSTSGDLSRLAVHLSGVVKRSAYGANGWSDMVGDDVSLDIRVRIHRAE